MTMKRAWQGEEEEGKDNNVTKKFTENDIITAVKLGWQGYNIMSRYHVIVLDFWWRVRPETSVTSILRGTGIFLVLLYNIEYWNNY